MADMQRKDSQCYKQLKTGKWNNYWFTIKTTILAAFKQCAHVLFYIRADRMIQLKIGSSDWLLVREKSKVLK